MRHPIVLVLGVLAFVAIIIFSCIGSFTFLTGNGMLVLNAPKIVMPNDVPAEVPTLAPTLPASINPGDEPSAPTATLPQEGADQPTATAVVPTEEPFTGLIIKDCPSGSLGYHPDSGKPLKFEMYPYLNDDGTGDANVLCEFEVLDLEQEVRIVFSPNVVAIVADWSHGTYNDDGTLKDACPTGWECEGVWVATDGFRIPVSTLGHFFVYIREAPAKQRFTEIISWADPSPGSMDPFACEYVATQGHTMWNIRVPAWAQAQGEVGTIYGFGLPVGDPNRLTCKGFPIDWVPQAGQLTTK